jgi:hypothetical protein
MHQRASLLALVELGHESATGKRQCFLVGAVRRIFSLSERSTF